MTVEFFSKSIIISTGYNLILKCVWEIWWYFISTPSIKWKQVEIIWIFNNSPHPHNSVES